MTADEWNELHPVGTPVRYWPLRNPTEGPPFDSRTRSKAWDLGHGQPVVLIEGKSGGMCLTHLDVLPPSTEATDAR